MKLIYRNDFLFSKIFTDIIFDRKEVKKQPHNNLIIDNEPLNKHS